jgi:hypothetical protein
VTFAASSSAAALSAFSLSLRAAASSMLGACGGRLLWKRNPKVPSTSVFAGARYAHAPS